MQISFLPMRVGFNKASTVAAMALAGLFLMAPNSNAALIGTVPTAPSSTVFPGLVIPGTSAGTLLANESVPYSFSTTSGTTSGTIVAAVYRESGGTLDFYYQVQNSAGSATGIRANSDTSFTGYTVATGYRVDGASLGNGFVNGSVPPMTADNNAAGSVVGFNFTPPETNKVFPGLSSTVLVISTNATNFTQGNASVIDGGTQTVVAYQPASSVPEPGSMLLLGAGMIALAGIRRFRS